MSQTPYLGSKISLISKLDIRYEGILYTVDSNEATIALSKVRSFGTEDRPTEHPVKPRDEVYEYIIFKASDIKDLVVCETPKQPELGGLQYDPAIISVSRPPKPAASWHEPPTSALPTSAKSSSSESPILKSVQQESSTHSPTSAQKIELRAPAAQRRPNNRSQGQGWQNAYNNRNYHHGGGNYQNYRQNGGRPFNRTSAPKEKLKFDNDYDFEKANEQFMDKLNVISDDLAEKVVFEDKDSSSEEEEVTQSDARSGYSKNSSFFDDISCEALEKAEGRSARPDWRKERQTNQETFGQQAVRNQAFHYRNRGSQFAGFRHQQPRPGFQRASGPQGGGFAVHPRYPNNQNRQSQPQF